MKYLRRILLIILVFAIILLATGFLLPDQVRIERSHTMNASSETVFNLVNNFRNWKYWSPWHNIDSMMVCEYDGPESGKGAVFTYMSTHPDVGSGRIHILYSHPYDSIVLLMDFMNYGKTTSNFIFRKTKDGTLVTWSIESKLGNNPVSRWFGVFMDKMVGFDLETGLSFLSDFAEADINEYENLIMSTEVPAKLACIMRDTASQTTLALKLEQMFLAITRTITANRLQISGFPYVRFHGYHPGYVDIEAGIPVDRKIQGNDSIMFVEYAATKALLISYFGPYNTSGKAYEALEKYLDSHHFSTNGSPWEEYITDPETQPDTGKWQTDIYYPVK